MTPEQRAEEVVKECTGQIRVTRYANDGLELAITLAIQDAIREAVAAERERCAVLAVESTRLCWGDGGEIARQIAAAIRK